MILPLLSVTLKSDGDRESVNCPSLDLAALGVDKLRLPA